MNTQPKLNIYLTRDDLRKLLWFLFCLEVVFVLIYLLVVVVTPDFPWGPIDQYFDLDEDYGSIPSWFASMQYMFIAVPTFICAVQLTEVKLISKKILYSIVGVSIFLALDEALRIHEKITVAGEKFDIKLLQALSINGHGSWISVYAFFAILLILFVNRDLLSIWVSCKKEGFYILVGGILLGMGEVGLEIVSYLFLRADAFGVLYNVEVALEELFALAGVSIILYGVLLLLMKVQYENQKEIYKYG